MSTFHKDYYDHSHSEEYDYDSSTDEERSMPDEEITSTLTDDPETPRPRSQYEVTENVDDIPNTESPVRPIVSNFTLSIPLNLATNTTANFNVTVTDNQSNNNSENSTESINNLKKNSISIFHVKAEFDDNNNKQEATPVQNIHIHRYPYFGEFKDYIHGVRKGIERGLTSFIHKHKHPIVNDPNVMAGPVFFFNKFRNKASDASANVHRAIFGHKFEHDHHDD